ncbi:MAG TPA: undecaprenyl-diphosphate phosphatase [Candidatus Angelobacter sp.]
MTFWQVVVLSIVQGLTELLPVSSSAHVVVAEKLMGLNPSSPEMTLLLVMLHTGTMFAVIVYFWDQWRRAFFADRQTFKKSAVLLIFATALTAIVGEGLVKLIERTMFRHHEKAEIEELFSHLELVAPALLAAGVLILIAGLRRNQNAEAPQDLNVRRSGFIGAVQGLCLPFRGFSRSGATISTGMLAGVTKQRAEIFSFALAVILTPPIVLREALRLAKSQSESGHPGLASAIGPSAVGLVCAFVAGLLALKWLSKWLESGRWYLFGLYCVVAAVAVFLLHSMGY